MKKKVAIALLCAWWTLSAGAQVDVEMIGNDYREVKAWIALMDESFPSEGIPPEYYELTVRENLPGSGPQRLDQPFLRRLLGHIRRQLIQFLVFHVQLFTLPFLVS